MMASWLYVCVRVFVSRQVCACMDADVLVSVNVCVYFYEWLFFVYMHAVRSSVHVPVCAW